MRVIMPVIRHADVDREISASGSIHQTLVGDEHGSTAIQLRLQHAPPGYRTRLHSHPYLEVLMVVSGEARAWMEGIGDPVRLAVGVTLAVPANTKHWFEVMGDQPFTLYGIHASPQRIVHFHDLL